MVANVTKVVKAIVLDIEGTTTSISFVKETLFPYVLQNLDSYFEAHWTEEECQKDIAELVSQASTESSLSGIEIPSNSPGDIPIHIKEDLIRYIRWLMGKDSKATPLKVLQGHMWREAYSNGDVKGHLFPDVYTALQHWYKSRIKVYIYSSGSVEAQKLLFQYSVNGDLTKYLSGHFDTLTGNKRDKSSYVSIMDSIGHKSSSVLFMTDVVQEARAAKEAGLQVLLVTRPGNGAISEEERQEFGVISSFNELTLVLPEEMETFERTDDGEEINKPSLDKKIARKDSTKEKSLDS